MNALLRAPPHDGTASRWARELPAASPFADAARSWMASAMPRFLFHILDGRRIVDRIGTEFDDVRDARAEAVRRAALLLASKAHHLGEAMSWALEMVEERGGPVFRLQVTAVQPTSAGPSPPAAGQTRPQEERRFTAVDE